MATLGMRYPVTPLGALPIFALLVLVGSGSDGRAGPKSTLVSLPEYEAHQECLGFQAFRFSEAEGSPLELGIIASAACARTRQALYRAILKIENRVFAQGYIRAAEREEPKLVAGVIARVRKGLPPF